MSSKTKSKHKPSRRKDKAATKKLRKAARREREALADGRAPMQPDPFQHQAAADPQDGAAVIHAVTGEALDHAAHRAAELADAVAHHEVAHPDVASEAQGHEVAPEAQRHEVAPEAPEASRDGQAGTQSPAEAQSQGGDDVAPVAALQGAATQLSETTTAVKRDTAQSVEQHLRDGVARVEETVSRATSWAPGGSTATLARYNTKVLEMVQANLAASTALFSALSQAKSLPEAVAINADHVSRQLDALTTQSRELASLAQTLTFEALKPFAGIVGPEG